MPDQPKISVIVTVYNEADVLADCLRSVMPFAAEVIVIDLESSDDLATVARAVAPDVRIVPHRRVPVVEEVRQFSLAQAVHEWVLILDPDERASDGLAAQLIARASSGNCGAVRIPRHNYIFGEHIHYSGWRGDSQIRFVRTAGTVWPPAVHSIPEIQGTVEALPDDGDAYLVHLNYTSVAQFVEKMNRYTTNEAQKMHRDGRRFSVKRLILNPAKQFWDRYVVLKGYKDGRHGLILSFLMTIYWALCYIKLWELERQVPAPKPPAS